MMPGQTSFIQSLSSDVRAPSNSQIAVYTGIFGDYDTLVDPPSREPGFDYVCFTDNPSLKSNIWSICHIRLQGLNNHMRNRKVKILAHEFLPSYQYSIYIDGNIEITGSLRELLEHYLQKHMMACPRHTARSNVFEEAHACIDLGYDRADRIKAQMERYERIGLPMDFPLSGNNILLRRHNEPTVTRIMKDWWDELLTGSKRDQLSLPFVLWKHGVEIAYMRETSYGEGGYFRKRPHKVKWLRRWGQAVMARKNRSRLFTAVGKLGRLVTRLTRKWTKGHQK